MGRSLALAGPSYLPLEGCLASQNRSSGLTQTLLLCEDAGPRREGTRVRCEACRSTMAELHAAGEWLAADIGLTATVAADNVPPCGMIFNCIVSHACILLVLPVRG